MKASIDKLPSLIIPEDAKVILKKLILEDPNSPFEEVDRDIFFSVMVVSLEPSIGHQERTSTFLVFLSLNDVEIQADEEEFEKIVLGVAEGKIDKAAVAEFLRKNSRY